MRKEAKPMIMRPMICLTIISALSFCTVPTADAQTVNGEDYVYELGEQTEFHLTACDGCDGGSDCPWAGV